MKCKCCGQEVKNLVILKGCDIYIDGHKLPSGLAKEWTIESDAFCARVEIRLMTTDFALLADDESDKKKERAYY